MTNRRLFLGVALVFGLLVAWFAFRPAETPTAKEHGNETVIAGPHPGPAEELPVTPSSVAPPAVAALAAARPPKAVAPAGVTGSTPRAATVAHPSVADPKTPDGAMTELLKAHRMIVDYHTLMGENPVGTNAEIVKALLGGNPHQAVLGPVEGQQFNAKGELVDPWGTPYFFHQLSGDVMEIHSAGPDKIMGTADDLVAK